MQFIKITLQMWRVWDKYLLHDNGRNVDTPTCGLDLGSDVLVVMAGSVCVTVSRASLLASSPRQLSFRVLLAKKTTTFTHKLLFPFYISVSMKKGIPQREKIIQDVMA